MAFSQNQHLWRILSCLCILFLLCLYNFFVWKIQKGFFLHKAAPLFCFLLFCFHPLFSSFASYTRHLATTFCVLATNLGLEFITLSLFFFEKSIFHLLYVSVIKFFVLQEFSCLHIDCFVFLQHPISYASY